MKKNTILVVDYPGAVKSAIYGLEEMFSLSNRVCREKSLNHKFEIKIANKDSLTAIRKNFDIIIFPPSMSDKYYLSPEKFLTDWIVKQHNRGSIICSTCAGCFILAASQILNNREATTHWNLAEKFKDRYPEVKIETNKILVRANDIITAGGMMAWIDLGFEIISRFTNPSVVSLVGKLLVIDTGLRAQQYYMQFNPKLNHGDETILSIQKKIHNRFSEKITTNILAVECNLTERTFLRRFVKATNLKPNEYLQKVRIQKACSFLEETNKTFEQIAYSVGYEDVSACRKVFNKIVGLTPKEFRNRFTIASKY